MDVLIVGASFAGLACARTAATLGLDTVVVDRKPEPGATPHTTGILVQEAAQAVDVPRHLTRRVPGVRLYSPSLRFVDLESPRYAFWATDVPGMMRWMADQTAATGARLQWGTRVSGLMRSADRIGLPGVPGAARYVVGADGARSQVARLAGLGRNNHVLMGVEAEFEGVRGVDPDRLHVFLDSHLAPGYIAWVVPGVGVIQVGLARVPGGRPELGTFISKLERVFDFRGARVRSHRAGPIPVGGAVSPSSTDRIILVGDAAGHVSPLTAGGIHNALELGRLTGRALADHLLDGGPPPHEVLTQRTPSSPVKHMLRAALELPPPNWMLDRLAFSRPALACARLVFFHHRGLLSLDGWRSLVEPASPVQRTAG